MNKVCLALVPGLPPASCWRKAWNKGLCNEQSVLSLSSRPSSSFLLEEGLTAIAESESKSDKRVSHVTVILLIHQLFFANNHVTSNQHQRTNLEVTNFIGRNCFFLLPPKVVYLRVTRFGCHDNHVGGFTVTVYGH